MILKSTFFAILSSDRKYKNEKKKKITIRSGLSDLNTRVFRFQFIAICEIQVFIVFPCVMFNFCFFFSSSFQTRCFFSSMIGDCTAQKSKKRRRRRGKKIARHIFIRIENVYKIVSDIIRVLSLLLLLPVMSNCGCCCWLTGRSAGHWPLLLHIIIISQCCYCVYIYT